MSSSICSLALARSLQAGRSIGKNESSLVLEHAISIRQTNGVKTGAKQTGIKRVVDEQIVVTRYDNLGIDLRRKLGGFVRSQIVESSIDDRHHHVGRVVPDVTQKIVIVGVPGEINCRPLVNESEISDVG